MAAASSSLPAEDVALMLAAGTHLGTRNCTNHMERYIWRRTKEGIHLIDLRRTIEKLKMAARIIVAIENPKDIVAISTRPFGQRAVLKFAQAIGCMSEAGRHTPGAFTNQIQKNFLEPRLIVVTDPRTDAQAVKESSYMGIPVLAFADSDSPLVHVDVAIPCNNKSKHSVGLMWWLLARMVLEMRGQPLETAVDLFFYREPEEVEAEAAEGEFAATAPAGAGGGGFGGFGGGFVLPGERPPAVGAADEGWGGPVPAPAEEGYGAAGGFEAADWAAPPPPAPAAAAAPPPADFAAIEQGTEYGGGGGGDFGAGYAPPAPTPPAPFQPRPQQAPGTEPTVGDSSWE